MKTVLDELTTYQSLSREEARQVLLDLTSGKYNPAQTAAFMTVYMMRNITVEELQGFRDAMLEQCVPVAFDQPVMDVCGTGGDGKNTFNISTLSAFVVAAAGQPVAKHGNYGVSSACGSSNVLEYFGYMFPSTIDALKRSLDRANICFMHAPLFHPALKHVAPVRKDLGVKTFFNMLGPLVNPALPKRQLAGVFSLELARKYAYLYQQSDKQFLILHALDGYDEISLTGAFKYFSTAGEQLAEPFDLGLSRVSAEDIAGGNTVEDAATIFMQVLAGAGTPAQQAVVTANAGMALYCADQTQRLPDAIARAKETLESGRALETFKKLLSA